MQVYYMNLWSSHYDKAYKLVKTRMLNVSVSSRKLLGASRLEQKIERLGLVSISQSFGERLVSVSDKKVSFTSLELCDHGVHGYTDASSGIEAI